MPLFQTSLDSYSDLDSLPLTFSHQLASGFGSPIIWFCQLFHSAHQQRKGLGSLILLTLRQLWNERNNRTFRHEEVLVTRFVVTLEDSRLWVFAGVKDLGSLVDLTSVAVCVGPFQQPAWEGSYNRRR